MRSGYFEQRCEHDRKSVQMWQKIAGFRAAGPRIRTFVCGFCTSRMLNNPCAIGASEGEPVAYRDTVNWLCRGTIGATEHRNVWLVMMPSRGSNNDGDWANHGTVKLAAGNLHQSGSKFFFDRVEIEPTIALVTFDDVEWPFQFSNW